MPATEADYADIAVCEEEVAELKAAFGVPSRRHFDIELDDYMLATRRYRARDRRAEVLFAITRPAGKVLLHTKPQYPSGLFRLFTGGVGRREPVLAALVREVREETGLTCEIESFLGLCTYNFTKGAYQTDFATYLFHLTAPADAEPRPQDAEVAQIGEIALAGLPAVAAHLRGLDSQRKVWGEWRAIGHEVAYQTLSRRMPAC